MIKQSDEFFKRSQAAQVAAGQMQNAPIAQSARKPLTDIELWKMWVESPSDVLRFARAIERAHGIGEV